MMARELVADDRELTHGGVQDPMLEGSIMREEQPHQGREHEEQGKQRKKPVVGD